MKLKTFLIVTLIGMIFGVISILQGPFAAALSSLGAAYSSMLWTWVLEIKNSA